MRNSAVLLSTLLLIPSLACAGSVSKCVNEQGNVTYTSERCPAGTALQEEIHIVNSAGNGPSAAKPSTEDYATMLEAQRNQEILDQRAAEESRRMAMEEERRLAEIQRTKEKEEEARLESERKQRGITAHQRKLRLQREKDAKKKSSSTGQGAGSANNGK